MISKLLNKLFDKIYVNFGGEIPSEKPKPEPLDKVFYYKTFENKYYGLQGKKAKYYKWEALPFDCAREYIDIEKAGCANGSFKFFDAERCPVTGVVYCFIGPPGSKMISKEEYMEATCRSEEVENP